MQIIGAIIIGLIVGALARLLMPGRDPMGWILTLLLGVAGAFTATMVGRGLNWYGPNENAGFIASVLGAVFLLWIYRAVSRKKR